jgi:AcrR family transcriptional regulator
MGIRTKEAGRTHAERRLEAQTRIVDAAFDLVASRGVDQLTLAEAGQAAGYSRALAAHYFGSREALLGAVAEHAVIAYRRQLALHEGVEAEGLEGLLSAVGFYLDDSRGWADQLRAYYEVANAALRWPSIAVVVARLNREAVDRLAFHVRAGQQRGEICADIDPEAQAVAVLGALHGIMTQWLLSPGDVDMNRVRAAYIASLRRTLTADANKR